MSSTVFNMANLNDRETYNRDNYPQRQTVDNTVTGTNETNIRRGSTPAQVSYRDGYVHGRDVEQQRLEVAQEVRDNDNAARGLLLGILLTGALGLATAAYFLTQRNDTPVPTRETIVVPRTSPAPQQSPQVRERVIERDRVVPVPQQPATPSNPAPAPNINITVPRTEAPAPAAPQVNAPASNAPANTQDSAPTATDSPATTPDSTTPAGTTANPQ